MRKKSSENKWLRQHRNVLEVPNHNMRWSIGFRRKVDGREEGREGEREKHYCKSNAEGGAQQPMF